MNETIVGKNGIGQEVREPEPRTFRITIERVVEIEGVNARDAVVKARRKFSIDIHSSIQRVEELVPQPPLTVAVKDGEWLDVS